VWRRALLPVGAERSSAGFSAASSSAPGPARLPGSPDSAGRRRIGVRVLRGREPGGREVLHELRPGAGACRHPLHGLRDRAARRGSLLRELRHPGRRLSSQPLRGAVSSLAPASAGWLWAELACSRLPAVAGTLGARVRPFCPLQNTATRIPVMGHDHEQFGSDRAQNCS